MSGAVIGFGTAATRELSTALGMPLEVVAAPVGGEPGDDMRWTFTDDIDTAAATVGAGAPLDRVVLCTWRDPAPAVPLMEVDHGAWLTEVEAQLGLWYRVAVSALQRCRDDASMVIVAERPAPIDVDGRGAVTAVAEGLITLGRSLAIVHGARGIRINTIGTELTTAPERLFGMAPPSPAFPGDVAGVADAVGLLLSPAAGAITGTLVRADYGRSW